MQTIAEPKISKLGTTRFDTDGSVDDLIQGRSAVLRMDPESGQPITFVAVATPEEGHALQTLFQSLAKGQTPEAEQLRSWVSGEVGYEVDWNGISQRYEKVAQAF